MSSTPMQQIQAWWCFVSSKAALLAKVGIVKVWKEEREAESRETYYDLTDDQFTLLAQTVAESDGAMKIVAHTAHEAAVPLVASR